MILGKKIVYGWTVVLTSLKIHVITLIPLLNVLNLAVNAFRLQLTRISVIVELSKTTFMTSVPQINIVVKIVKRPNAKSRMNNGNQRTESVPSLTVPASLIRWVRLNF